MKVISNVLLYDLLFWGDDVGRSGLVSMKIIVCGIRRVCDVDKMVFVVFMNDYLRSTSMYRGV